MKDVVWVSSSKKDLLKLPDGIRTEIGHALFIAQMGKLHGSAKVLKGFGAADIIEIIQLDGNGTYRAIYTVKFQDVLFVLHVFQKKSKQGIKTPAQDMDLVKNRLKLAHELYNERIKK